MRPGESFIEQPVRSLQTMLRVLAEDDILLPIVVPDGIYGPSTMNAVSAFQRKNGMPITGVVDQITWEMIAENYESAIIRIEKAQPIEISLDPNQVFQKNDSNPYIYLLQSMLTQLSKDHPAINPPSHSGILDEETTNSLKAFQALANLPTTGEFDKITWKHLVLQFMLNANSNKDIP